MRLADIEGHPNLKKDLDNGAIINVGENNLRERKEAMRKRSRDMEFRISELEQTVKEMATYIRNNNKR